MSKRPINVEVRAKYKDEPIERMVKRFSKKVKKERIIEKVIAKQRYEKPSAKRKREAQRKKKVLEKIRLEQENKLKAN